jgi:UDP-glucuronate 4-epimerase
LCVDNFNDYYAPETKEKNLSEAKNNTKFRLYRADITDYDAMENIFKENKIDAVIHLAARAGVRPSIDNPLLYARVNINGTLNLLELSRKYNMKYFVFGSSSSVYGSRTKTPFKETDMTDSPISPYASSKKSAEAFCYVYSSLFNMNIICLRFFTVYGPRGRPDMAPYLFTKRIDENEEIKRFGDGKTKRDYTYISDIVDGIYSSLLLLLENKTGFEIINLGNSKPVELNYFIEVIEKALGEKAKIKQCPIQKGDVPLTYASLEKAERLLNYNPKVSIEEGMKKFTEWYKKNKND